jgi:hypothetical protein
MELLFKLKPGAKAKLTSDDPSFDPVRKQGMVFKDGDSIGLEKGTYVYIYGADDAEKTVRDMLKDLGEEVTGSDKQKALEKIKAEDSTAQEGFGSIFG